MTDPVHGSLVSVTPVVTFSSPTTMAGPAPAPKLAFEKVAIKLALLGLKRSLGGAMKACDLLIEACS